MIVAGTLVAGCCGPRGLGYLTLRLRGVFFAIASLALAVVLFTFVVNWDYVGGARGAYVPAAARGALRPAALHPRALYRRWCCMAAVALIVARTIETSTIGRGLAAIRDDELAAECSGVPTLRLEDSLHHGERRAHGHGGNHLPVLPLLHRAELGVQPDVRREQHRDAADRRHDELDRARSSARSCWARCSSWCR